MNNIYYQIQDEKGNYVDEYTFTTGSIQKVLDYLIHTNEQLGLNKKFKIVPIDENTVLKFDGKIICEELNI